MRTLLLALLLCSPPLAVWAQPAPPMSPRFRLAIGPTVAGFGITRALGGDGHFDDATIRWAIGGAARLEYRLMSFLALGGELEYVRLYGNDPNDVRGFSGLSNVFRAAFTLNLMAPLARGVVELGGRLNVGLSTLWQAQQTYTGVGLHLSVCATLLVWVSRSIGLHLDIGSRNEFVFGVAGGDDGALNDVFVYYTALEIRLGLTARF
ncbi:MAG: hypothetical protein KC609_00470 [Myxococcales bacterium]|nr:hypothetical protein [Myxococcales bacterium]